MSTDAFYYPVVIDISNFICFPQKHLSMLQVFITVSFICIFIRHFLPANATSTFRSIISSYPGKLVLVSIQVLWTACYSLLAFAAKPCFVTVGCVKKLYGLHASAGDKLHSK